MRTFREELAALDWQGCGGWGCSDNMADLFEEVLTIIAAALAQPPAPAEGPFAYESRESLIHRIELLTADLAAERKARPALAEDVGRCWIEHAHDGTEGHCVYNLADLDSKRCEPFYPGHHPDCHGGSIKEER